MKNSFRKNLLVSAVMSLALLSGCNSSNSKSADNEFAQPKSIEISLGKLDPATSLSRNYAYPYEDEIPDFPTSIANYSLMTQTSPEQLRLFLDDEWKVPIKEFNPDFGGGATMSCEPYYWILRWRSDTPDLEIAISTGMTDGPYDPFDNVTSGGVGVSEGFSCAVPAFQFRKGESNTNGNLVDVNFEYQIWEYKPRI
jgi:hypothetical protein